VLQQWQADRFVLPAPVDQRTLLELDTHLLAVAKNFEALDLSPLAPLAGVLERGAHESEPDKSPRSGETEVVSIHQRPGARERPTFAAGLTPGGTTRHLPSLCARAGVPESPRLAAHFRIFCMTTAGRESQDRVFLTTALVEHIQTHLSALDRLEQHGYHFGERRLQILATPENDALASRIASAIDTVPVSTSPLKHGYYAGLRFRIDVGPAPERPFP